ncbi:hypothetical protein EYF80_043434 [Liparis tanakae]|uniref:Uncharacterized protein n=1 Tax=Liparis tanakae TaxID=230148 RepID=A0A4Z2G0L3_9TELE|nr:hypothetical protein EYF80_043434 [Liparis tanakae]
MTVCPTFHWASRFLAASGCSCILSLLVASIKTLQVVSASVSQLRNFSRSRYDCCSIFRAASRAASRSETLGTQPCFNGISDFLPGLHPLTGPLDEVIRPLLGIQPVGGVLLHIVELLRPVVEFRLGVFPVLGCCDLSVQVSLMCCGSAGCRPMARTPSDWSNQPSMEPMFSCSSAVAVRASTDLQDCWQTLAQRALSNLSCARSREASSGVLNWLMSSPAELTLHSTTSWRGTASVRGRAPDAASALRPTAPSTGHRSSSMFPFTSCVGGYELALHLNPARVELELAGLH